MTRQGRGLSSEQKGDLWRRWREGQSLDEIGRALGKLTGSIRWVVAEHGGLVPSERRRSRLALTLAEREDVSRGLAAGDSLRQIAARLRRYASTISREVSRHGGRENYRASHADERAWDNAKRPKPCRLASNDALRRLVASKLRIDWSPEQVCEWLRLRYPDNGVARDDLPESFCASPRCFEEGALRASALGEEAATLQEGKRSRRSQCSDRGRHLDS